jgi:hypothetical protein
MTVDGSDEAARTERIEAILEELRLNTEDLHELARQAKERAIGQRKAVQTLMARARAASPRRLGKKR